METTWTLQATIALRNNQVIEGTILKDGTIQTYGDTSYFNQLPKINALFRQLGLTTAVVTEQPEEVLDYTYRFNYIGADGDIDVVGGSSNLDAPVEDCVGSCGLVDDPDLVSVVTELSPYVLVVNGGTGSGSYPAGTIINIISDSPPSAGYGFGAWVVSSGSPIINGVNSSNAFLVMPASDVVVGSSFVSTAGLFLWGDGRFGSRGDGTENKVSSPVQLGSATDWTTISSEASFGGIRSGKLFVWGFNGAGQLCNGTMNDVSSPIQVGSDTNWEVIVEGYTSFGIRGGKLFGWGNNQWGTIGNGERDNKKSSPVQVGSLTDWTAISTYSSSSIGVRGGKLFGWGVNQYGQLGTGTTDFFSSPVQIGSETGWTAAVTKAGSSACIRDGKLFLMGINGSPPDSVKITLSVKQADEVAAELIKAGTPPMKGGTNEQ